MTELNIIRHALEFVPALDRELWIKVGMGIKSELGDAGFDLWDEWSSQAASYNPKAAKATWRSFKEGGAVGIGTVFHEARQRGFSFDGSGRVQSLDPAEIQAHQQRRQSEEAAIQAKADLAAKQATHIWKIAKSGAHLYSDNKQIAHHLARVIAAGTPECAGCFWVTGENGNYVELTGDLLVLPMYNTSGELRGLLAIDENGQKSIMKGTKKQGLFIPLTAKKLGPEYSGTIYFAEGFATAATIHEITQKPTVASIDAGNLPHVAKAWRMRHPQARMIICGDLDKSGVGQKKANEAALAAGGTVSLPPFTAEELAGDEPPSDWNDYAALHGPEAVNNSLAAPQIATGAEAKILSIKRRDTYAAPDEAHDPHRNQPKPDEAMLYGLVGEVGLAAASTTEANPYAAALNFLTFLSATVGRDVYFPLGNTWHHPRLFSLHVGRTSRGRKGDAISLPKRIHGAIEKAHLDLDLGDNGAERTVPLLGQMHDGGLSSREGLVVMIHDGYKDGKDLIAPYKDKRLWIIESEFANILHQSKRDGNTLSPALRDAWDGISIKPAIKNNRVWASFPHIAISAACTPSELRSLMLARELTNGFANRFLIIWAERTKLLPYPTPTSIDEVRSLAARMEEIVTFAKGGYPDVHDTRRMMMTHSARVDYGELYRTELNRNDDGDLVGALLERRAPMLLRIAMLFALTDLTLEIDSRHIKASLAWIRYWRESVKFIFADAADDGDNEVSQDLAQKIMTYLQEKGEATRTEITAGLFHGHVSKDRIDSVLDMLLTDTPQKISVHVGEKQANGKRPKTYRLCELGKHGETEALAWLSPTTQICKLGELTSENHHIRNPISQSSPASLANIAPADLADRPSSPISPNSHGVEQIEVEV